MSHLDPKRIGRITASMLPKLMRRLRDGSFSAEVRNYLHRVAIEQVVGVEIEVEANDAMRRGTELEPKAKKRLQQIVGPGEDVPCMVSERFGNFAATPDLRVRNMLYEIKCPSAERHLDNIINGKHADEYEWQVKGQIIACEGKIDVDGGHVVSYHPDFPEELQIVVSRMITVEGNDLWDMTTTLRDAEDVIRQVREKIAEQIATYKRGLF